MKKVNVKSLALFALVAFYVHLAAPGTVTAQQFEFDGWNYNGSHSVYNYTFTSGTQPAISHSGLQGFCVGSEDIISVELSLNGATYNPVSSEIIIKTNSQEPLCLADFPALKFNQGFQDGQTINFRLTLNGYFPPKMGQGWWKGGTTGACFEIQVPDCDQTSANPMIDIEKAVNGEDADAPTGPMIPIGSAVNWTYVVTNPGTVALSNVTVVDDMGVVPVYQSGDLNNNDSLDTDETWIYTASGIAVQGQYKNIGTATGTFDDQTVRDDDPAHYFGIARSAPGIKIVKYVNEEDANEPTGPVVTVGSTVTFTYVVTNTGNVPLADVSVDDDKPGVNPAYQSGDANEDGLLDTDETWIYTATAAAVEGQYKNIGTVTGTYEDQTVNDDDPAHYFGEYETGCVDGTVYSNGQPQANVLVRLETPGRKAAKQHTDGNGYYRFDNVIRGFEYTLTVNGQPELTRTVVVDDQLACQTQDLFGGGCKPVFALYQTWYGNAENDSTLRYWATSNKGGITDTSVVGFYDSHDEKIMEYHVLLA